MKSSVERIIREFLDYCRDRYDPETLRHYEMNMQRFQDFIQSHTTRCKEYHSRWYQEQQKPEAERDFSWAKEYARIQHAEDIDRDFIARYTAFVNHDEVSTRTNQVLNQSEKESRLYPLKTFLRYCRRKGYITDDLCKFVYVPAREKKVMERALTVEEMERLLDVPDTEDTWGIRNQAILELSYSGLRSEEMLLLKVGEVDTVTNTITILDGKGNKDRVVPMTSEGLYWMKRWLSRRGQVVPANCEYVFVSKRKQPITRRVFLTMVKTWAKDAGILIDLSPHDLRRTTGTHLAARGAPIRQIQALLGHASLAVTTKYLRLADETIKQEFHKSHPASRRDMHYATGKDQIH